MRLEWENKDAVARKAAWRDVETRTEKIREKGTPLVAHQARGSLEAQQKWRSSAARTKPPRRTDHAEERPMGVAQDDFLEEWQNEQREEQRLREQYPTPQFADSPIPLSAMASMKSPGYGHTHSQDVSSGRQSDVTTQQPFTLKTPHKVRKAERARHTPRK